MMKEYFMERVRVDKETHKDSPDPVNILKRQRVIHYTQVELNNDLCILLL
jgi:hypothetical protein